MLLGFVLLGTVALAVFVAAPLLSAEAVDAGSLPVDVTPLLDLKRRRLVVYENLKDLEFEYQAGKIAQDDYTSLRQNYMAEAAQLMIASQSLEEMSSEGALIEREVAVRRSQRKSLQQKEEEYVCPKCGFESPLPAKFCGQCGARIKSPSRK